MRQSSSFATNPAMFFQQPSFEAAPRVGIGVSPDPVLVAFTNHFVPNPIVLDYLGLLPPDVAEYMLKFTWWKLIFQLNPLIIPAHIKPVIDHLTTLTMLHVNLRKGARRTLLLTNPIQVPAPILPATPASDEGNEDASSIEINSNPPILTSPRKRRLADCGTFTEDRSNSIKKNKTVSNSNKKDDAKSIAVMKTMRA